MPSKILPTGLDLLSNHLKKLITPRTNLLYLYLLILKNMKKKIGLGLLVLLVIIQFIRPTRNISSTESPNEISKFYNVPDEIHAVLKKSCYDCHSNNTNYPWYVNIQPVGWWLQRHINEGKKELNFEEFGTYVEKRAKHKFDEIEELVREGEMPLGSYTLIHRDAKLTPEQSEAIAAWAGALK